MDTPQQTSGYPLCKPLDTLQYLTGCRLCKFVYQLRKTLDIHSPQSHVCDEVASGEVEVLEVRSSKGDTTLPSMGGLFGALLHMGGGERESGTVFEICTVQ